MKMMIVTKFKIDIMIMMMTMVILLLMMMRLSLSSSYIAINNVFDIFSMYDCHRDYIALGARGILDLMEWMGSCQHQGSPVKADGYSGGPGC